MRAIRHDGARIYLDPRADVPAPAPGEAVLRPLRMAVGPADARIVRNHAATDSSAPQPVTLGHEFVGTVERLHDSAERDIRKRWEGRRVVGSPIIVCTRCDMCRAGLSAHCRARRVLGRWGRDGCLAEQFMLPLRNLVEVPREVDDDRAAFAWALAAAAHAPHLVRIEGKPYVTILGDSAEALLAAQVMTRLNASVRLLGDEPRRFTLCEKWGIKHRHMSEAGRRADQDIVVDWTGSPAGLELAMSLVRPRGKIVLCASSDAAPPLAPLVEHEIELIGSRAGNLADAIAFLARAEIDPLPLITRRMRLSDGPAILQAASAGHDARIVVEA